jgi:ABC-type polysaccharide/polyol phosphate transport system ATPase subunit
MGVIEVKEVSKTFLIPSERRDTVREHAFGILRSRQFTPLEVLRNITFDLDSNEALGIMGRNGCGKTTLLKIIAGIYAPDSGTVSVRAPITPILGLGIGWNGELSARDNICLTATAMGMSLREIKGQLESVLAFADLERFADVQLKFFSSGMSARLAYAIAFKAVQGVLLLDEVFAVGDGAFVARCERQFLSLREQGHPVILVSHQSDIVARFCQRALLIDGGSILMDDRADKVASSYDELMRGKPILVASDER